MLERITTVNGHTIEKPTDKMTAQEYRSTLGGEYGIDGASPHERIAQLKQLSNEGVAILMEHINKAVQGSEDSLMNSGTTFIGDISTIRPEDRYSVFTDMIEAIREAPEDTSPARVADVLALGVVMLHPFQDGNGRTARTIGLTFREQFDTKDYQLSYNIVSASREAKHGQGGFMIHGYVPHLPEGFDQSDPEQVSGYLKDLLHQESPDAYTSCFGQAPLRDT